MVETRSKKRKRQRLMSISSNVSSWPDLPARFESLNDDTLTTILEFVGNKSYRPFGGLNYHCKEIYLLSGMKKETYLYGYAPLSVITDRYDRTSSKAVCPFALGVGVLYFNRSDVLDWVLEERKKDLLNGICIAAAAEERLNILEEVWNNIDDDDKREIFHDVDYYAARYGKLNVLKWLCTKGLSVDKKGCALQAALHGQLHVLQWLREEQGLELDGSLYHNAIQGGRLHVMKWLREQGCPWGRSHVACAALFGRVEVLQWLHDEGYPWLDDGFLDDVFFLRVNEGDYKPEVKEWLHANGFRNRLESD